jgi:hypothetical protein
MYDIPFDRPFLRLSNGIRHVMPSTDTKPELTAKASVAQPVSQPAVYASGLKHRILLTKAIFRGINVPKRKVVEKLYVLLNVYPCITLQIKPTWCTIFLSMFISFSRCFGRLCAHHQEEQLYFLRHLVLVILCG